MRSLCLALMLSLAMPTAVALAEDHGDAHGESAEHGDGHDAHGGAVSFEALTHSIDFWGAVVNFTLLALLFFKFGLPKINAGLAAKREEIQAQLEEAKRLKEEAEAKHAEYEKKLAGLDAELERVEKEMRETGEAERDRIIAEAEQKAHRMRQEAEFLIAQRVKQLESTLTREAVDAAIQAAEEALTKNTNAEDQTRLAQAYLTAIAEGPQQENRA